MPPMNRREAVKTTAAVLGGVLLTASGFVAGCSRDREPPASGRALTADEQALIEEIADTLLPTTAASPGAKAAGAGEAIALLLTDCYEPEQQDRVVKGLAEFRGTCAQSCGAGFASLPRAERERLVREVDAEALRVGDSHYFGLVRELALRSYFSSEIGMTKARRWIPEPGRWVGCMPLRPGQPAWS